MFGTWNRFLYLVAASVLSLERFTFRYLCTFIPKIKKLIVTYYDFTTANVRRFDISTL